jgi:hypothetical protein
MVSEAEEAASDANPDARDAASDVPCATRVAISEALSDTSDAVPITASRAAPTFDKTLSFAVSAVRRATFRGLTLSASASTSESRRDRVASI